MKLSDIPRNPDPTLLRQFGFLCAGASLLFAGFRAYQGDSSVVLWGLVVAGVCAGIAVLKPALLKYVFIGWMLAVFPIGWTISHVLLLLVFGFLFTPLGIIMRLSRICKGAFGMRKASGTTMYGLMIIAW